MSNDKPFMVRRSRNSKKEEVNVVETNEEVKPNSEPIKKAETSEKPKRRRVTNGEEKRSETKEKAPLKEDRPKQEKEKPEEKKEEKKAEPVKVKKTKKKQDVSISEEEKETKQKSAGIVANKKIINSEVVGDADDEFVYQLEKVKNQDEELYKKLLENKENKTICWGTVSAVEPDTGIGKATITVMWKGIRVLIPDSAYFEDSWNFGSEYEKLSSKEKTERREKAARETIMSNCPFIVVAVIKNEITEGNHAGEEEIIAYGDRLSALEKLRDIYFIHKETNDPVEVNINDQANANVVYVAEDFATVECLGVETRINAYNLNEDYVDNCKDFVSPGDVIKVRIKRIGIEGKKVYLSATGRLNLGSKAMSSLKIGGSYLGTVESFNKGKSLYTIKLRNGVNVSVHEGNVQGHTPINIGDRVAVMIKELKQEYAFGVAMKV